MTIDQFDKLEAPCPMLGHSVFFHYCRTTLGKELCRRLLNCWFERIPIREYAEEHFTPEMLEKLLQSPPSKLVTLVELIERARRLMPMQESSDNESKEEASNSAETCGA